MSPEVTAAIVAGSVGIVTVIATVIVQIVGFRSTKANTEQQIRATHKDTADTLEHQREQLNETLKAQSDQLDRTLAEQRTRTLNERFATASEQLGSDKPAVRLAGVYAMAGLADDWSENRQTCVDVLCAYLRMPYEPDPGQDASEPERLAFQATREVRHTVIRVITAHLQEDAAVSWQGLNFDFTGVVFDGGDFTGAQFSGGTVNFISAQFTDYVTFFDAGFSGGTVNFNSARFSGGRVIFTGARFSGGAVLFGWAQLSGGGLDFSHARFSGGTLFFNHAQFSAGALYFTATQFVGSRIDFSDAQFSGAMIDFKLARFSGGAVDFSSAEFSGGTVDFSDAVDWSPPPAFPWTGAPPPGVKLPEKENQAEA
jgi:uncharacterized protein YjbI with pentapeptide repeats/uncharacterized membrane-anchored protein YhcB (DUF1043 family)